MRRLLLAGVAIAAFATIGAGSATAGTPPGNGLQNLPATCNGSETTTITASNGAAFYVDGQKYVLQSITFADGFSFTKNYGSRTGLTGGSIECTGTVTTDQGTTSFDGLGISSK